MLTTSRNASELKARRTKTTHNAKITISGQYLKMLRFWEMSFTASIYAKAVRCRQIVGDNRTYHSLSGDAWSARWLCVGSKRPLLSSLDHAAAIAEHFVHELRWYISLSNASRYSSSRRSASRSNSSFRLSSDCRRLSQEFETVRKRFSSSSRERQSIGSLRRT
jgi:hypothetical protein